MTARVSVLLCGIFLLAIAGWAAANGGGGKAASDYIKVEIRGKLQVVGDKQELVDRQAIQFNATILDMGLVFGDNKELAALAKKLNGKTVLINGYLRRWSQLTAGPPTHYVHYVQVTALKAAE
jgi:hypothetical protein